jgi:protein tyrosine phosphatase type 4A
MSPSMTMTCQQTLLNPLTLIENLGMRFLVFDAPSTNTLPLYLKVNNIYF